MFAFFPWLRLDPGNHDEPINLGRFTLISYVKTAEPDTTLPLRDQIIESTLSRYYINDKPVSRATLIQVDGMYEFDEYTPWIGPDLFAFRDIISFSGLSTREFFSQSSNYCNSGCFDLHIQGRVNPRYGLITQSRTRDGWSTHLGTRKVHCPSEVSGHSNVKLDLGLAQALMASHQQGQRNKYEVSIKLFNNANTDSPQKDIYEELHATVSAFEQLLGIYATSREELFVEKIMTRLSPSAGTDRPLKDNILKNDKSRRKYSQRSTVLEIWARDIYQWRGYFAHGEIPVNVEATANARGNILTPDIHLVLATYIFPRLIKLILAEDGLYEITASDQDEIDLFETLICLDFNQLQLDLNEYEPDNQWVKAIRSFISERERLRMIEEMYRRINESGVSD